MVEVSSSHLLVARNQVVLVSEKVVGVVDHVHQVVQVETLGVVVGWIVVVQDLAIHHFLVVAAQVLDVVDLVGHHQTHGLPQRQESRGSSGQSQHTSVVGMWLKLWHGC